MEKKTIQLEVSKLLLKISRAKNIKFDSLFVNNNKIDSLDLLNLYSLLEKKYKIKFKSNELTKLTSINNIYRIISKKNNEKKAKIVKKKLNLKKKLPKF